MWPIRQQQCAEAHSLGQSVSSKPSQMANQAGRFFQSQYLPPTQTVRVKSLRSHTARCHQKLRLVLQSWMTTFGAPNRELGSYFCEVRAHLLHHRMFSELWPSTPSCQRERSTMQRINVQRTTMQRTNMQHINMQRMTCSCLGRLELYCSFCTGTECCIKTQNALLNYAATLNATASDYTCRHGFTFPNVSMQAQTETSTDFDREAIGRGDRYSMGNRVVAALQLCEHTVQSLTAHN